MKKVHAFILLIMPLLLTGCWDRIDIENRGYVLGVAIDKYPPIPENNGGSGKEEAGEQEEEKFEVQNIHTGKPLYAMTIQVPIIKKALLTAPFGGGGGGSEGGSKTWELTQVGNSFMEMNRAIAERVSLSPYYEQLQIIIISEDVAKEGLNNITDFFARDAEMRRRTKVFISSEGNAKKVLDVTPRIDDYSSVYLAKVSLNTRLNAGIIYHTDLGEAMQNIHAGLDFMLPKVDSTKDEVRVGGAAMFQGDRMVGSLNELEVEAVQMIQNLYKGGILTVEYPNSPRGIITLEVTKAKTKVKPRVDGNSVRFEISISIDGNYAENVSMSSQQRISSDYLKSVEKLFSSYIEKQCTETVKKVQSEFNADIFHFNKILKEEEPTYWKWARDKWRDIFPAVEVKVDAQVAIRQVGNTR